MHLRQGVEGQLIRYEEGYDALDEQQRLQGAKWRIDPSLGKLHGFERSPKADLRSVAALACGATLTPRNVLHIGRGVHGAAVSPVLDDEKIAD